MDQNTIIYWQHDAGNTYLYGSKITYLDTNHVLFENELFPSGAKIHAWQSQGNYQAQRMSVQLPILRRDHSYRLYIDALAVPKKTLFVQVTFYDRYDTVIDQVIIKKQEQSFIYPKQAFWYEVALINAGLRSLDFYNIRIAEESESKDNWRAQDGLYLSHIKNTTPDATVLNIIFNEPVSGSIRYVPKNIVNQLHDVMELTTSRISDTSYIHENDAKLFMDWCYQLNEQYEIRHINLIGYGSISNQAALYFANKFQYSTAYLTANAESTLPVNDSHEQNQYVIYDERNQNKSLLPNLPIDVTNRLQNVISYIKS